MKEFIQKNVDHWNTCPWNIYLLHLFKFGECQLLVGLAEALDFYKKVP